MKSCRGCLHWCVCSIREDNIRCGYFMERKKTAPKPQTNADRIRAMSDEELAAYLVYHNPYSTEEFCLEWLRQPVKDGDNDVG